MDNKISAYKIIFYVLLGLILVWILISFIYNSIHQSLWEDQNKAITKAYEQTALVSAVKAEPFSLEESFMIIYGKDAENRDLIVWVGEYDVHSEYASDGLSKKQIKAIMLEKDPKVQIERITPGRYKEEWVWEVYYLSSQFDAERRSYYDYYRFSDGALLETYRMSAPR